MLRTTAWLAAVTLAVVVPACHKTRARSQLESRNAAVIATYELHRDVDFTAFLAAQPPDSVDAMMVDPMPPPVIVLAKVSLVAPVARSVHPPRFVTTLRLSDGTSASKPWQATSSAGRSDYRAIFGLPKDVVLADTVLAPAP